ncbi:MAG: hypothetical protein NUW23_08805 [Firmicutes bacterium]|jgi:hypothetical protein|nr:hypothetical protein [Bacillota bacterium]
MQCGIGTSDAKMSASLSRTLVIERCCSVDGAERIMSSNVPKHVMAQRVKSLEARASALGTDRMSRLDEQERGFGSDGHQFVAYAVDPPQSGG